MRELIRKSRKNRLCLIMPELEKDLKFTKQRIVVLLLWFGVLMGIRILLGFLLQSIWFGTLGAVTITFVFFYLALKYSRFQRYRQLINSSLMLWYRKKFFYVSGLISLVVLGSILGFIEYGYARYSDKLIVAEMSREDVYSTLQELGATNQLRDGMGKLLQKYSPTEIAAITLASADKSLSGYYSKIISYMFAEDLEIMVFMLLLRRRREIFAAQNQAVS